MTQKRKERRRRFRFPQVVKQAKRKENVSPSQTKIKSLKFFFLFFYFWELGTGPQVKLALMGVPTKARNEKLLIQPDRNQILMNRVKGDGNQRESTSDRRKTKRQKMHFVFERREENSKTRVLISGERKSFVFFCREKT